MEDDDFERARKNRKVSFTGDDNDGLPDDYGIDDFGNEEFGNDPYGDDYGNETMGTPMGGGNEEGGLQADALFESSGLKKKKNVAVLQTKRWNEILGNMILEGEKKGLSEEFVLKMFKAIHQESINNQEKVINS